MSASELNSANAASPLGARAAATDRPLVGVPRAAAIAAPPLALSRSTVVLHPALAAREGSIPATFAGAASVWSASAVVIRTGLALTVVLTIHLAAFR